MNQDQNKIKALPDSWNAAHNMLITPKPEIDLNATKAMGQVVYKSHNDAIEKPPYTKRELKMIHALEEVKDFLDHIEGRVGQAAHDNIYGIVEKALPKNKK